MNEAEPIHDYSAYTEEVTPEGELSTLSTLAEQARLAEEEVALAQRKLKSAQDTHKRLVEVQIPELMDKIGMAKFSTSLGINIEVKETIRASMGTGPQKEQNIGWLESNGHEAIVKMAVVVAFGRGEAEREAAAALAKKLRGEGVGAEFERKVEPATLSALIRELLEEGRPVPEAEFGVFRQRIAKIT
jgi:hypothetical protein